MTQATSRLARTLFRTTALAAALLLAYGNAGAQSAAERANEIRRDMYSLESSASVGLGFVTDDNRRFGQHRALNQKAVYGLLDVDFIQREEATGTWLKVFGKNLGLDNRELRLTHERQGDWAYWFQGSQFKRREPLIVNTGLQGAGTANQSVSATATKRDLDLKVDRDIVTLGVRKFVTGAFDVKVSFTQDESSGARMLGRGTSNVMEFLTEPIDRVTRQWQLVLGYADRKMQFSGGYSGSSYDNKIPVLNSTGGNSAPSAFGPLWAMAMPPSNAAHQLHLAGGYNLSDRTRASFKLSHTVAVQNETFSPVFTRLAGAPESLNGKLVTTLALADLSMRPLRQVDVVASVRLEDRDDQTPEARYLAEIAPTAGGSFSSAGVTGLNKPRSLKQLKGLLEAGYRLDGGYRLVAGLEQEDMKRNVSSKFRRVGFREKTDETTTRLEFKRAMSDVLNGGVSLLHSERGGSEYIADTFDPNALTNQVNALLWADRIRDKLRVTADWLPDERWSAQFMADLSQDTYSGRPMGPRKGNARFVSGDVTYKINDKWNFTGWLSQEHTQSTQATRSDRVGAVAAGYNTLWDADLRYTTRAVGFTVKGQLRSNLELGADFSRSTDVVQNNMAQTGGTGTLPVNSLPDYFYSQHRLKLSADYALEKKSGVRFEVAFDRRRTDDWTWENWVYNGSPAIAAAARTSDGTTVRNVPSENVAFVGISYHFRWR